MKLEGLPGKRWLLCLSVLIGPLRASSSAERTPSSSWQYFPVALTIKYNFHCHYLENDIKCAHFIPESLQSGPSQVFPLPNGQGRFVKVWTNIFIQTFRRACPPFIVWIFPKSEMDAACQVHVWHVSGAYTIISSSSLSEFIVLNFCPPLNIRGETGIWFKLVNGCQWRDGVETFLSLFVCSENRKSLSDSDGVIEF